MGKLEGQVAVVTGAGAGIGRAIARALAAEGACVGCSDIRGASAEETAAQILETKGEAFAQQCDVTDAASVRAAVAAVAERYQGLHIAVANAAVFTPLVPIGEMEEADWHRTIAVNLTGAFHLAKYSIPLLKRTGGGSIILVASQMARVANAGQAAYCATKGALVQLAKGIALDHVRDGIRANTLSPGGTGTERMVRRFGSLPEAERQWGIKHPMGRLARPEEIAAGAVFLAAKDSSFMTGADLLIDGGYTAW
jgi:NAD(P)-dependent dehydrogenase (short-subunit alcohol dehydrogenase family)